MCSNIVQIISSEEIFDKTATTSCPKYNFGQVEISSMCTKCLSFKGIERMIDVRTGIEATYNGNWHNTYAVKCAFPMQRRIHKIQKVIKG